MAKNASRIALVDLISPSLGFTGVMYDGSTLPYGENLANTKKAVAMAAAYNCGVEAELGALAARKAMEADAEKAMRVFAGM